MYRCWIAGVPADQWIEIHDRPTLEAWLARQTAPVTVVRYDLIRRDTVVYGAPGQPPLPADPPDAPPLVAVSITHIRPQPR